MLALPEGARWITQSGSRRARVIAAAQRGGVRVDGGEGGFAERTVSLQDLAWTVVADIRPARAETRHEVRDTLALSIAQCTHMWPLMSRGAAPRDRAIMRPIRE
jgi:hypothetical protein